MKTFVYTSVVTSGPRAAYETRRTTLWKVVRNKLHKVGTYDSQFESTGQAAVNCAVQHKVLPAKLAGRSAIGIENDGIARFYEV